MFGAKASNSRSWLEKPDQNYLSWSFGMCVLAAFLAFIAMLCQLLEFARLRLEYSRGDDPSVFLTDQAPPESRWVKKGSIRLIHFRTIPYVIIVDH